MIMTQTNTFSGLVKPTEFTGASTSSVLLDSQKKSEGRQITVSSKQRTWGFVSVLLVSASISSNVYLYKGNGFSNASTLDCHYSTGEEKQDINILYGFIANLIADSEDLDGRIVNMVSENFWNLI
jgi:hypothetical protein